MNAPKCKIKDQPWPESILWNLNPPSFPVLSASSFDPSNTWERDGIDDSRSPSGFQISLVTMAHHSPTLSKRGFIPWICCWQVGPTCFCLMNNYIVLSDLIIAYAYCKTPHTKAHGLQLLTYTPKMPKRYSCGKLSTRHMDRFFQHALCRNPLGKWF